MLHVHSTIPLIINNFYRTLLYPRVHHRETTEPKRNIGLANNTE